MTMRVERWVLSNSSRAGISGATLPPRVTTLPQSYSMSEMLEIGQPLRPKVKSFCGWRCRDLQSDF